MKRMPKEKLSELSGSFKEFYERHGRLPKTKLEAANDYILHHPGIIESVQRLIERGKA